MSVRVRFVWQDMWLGVYYKRTSIPSRLTIYNNGPRMIERTVYLCLLPMLPIVVSWRRRDPYYDCSDFGRHAGPWKSGFGDTDVCEACGLEIGK